ncbi:hypothetical protein PYK79_31760 [Streptomyces sp. ID05-04B]|uniref:hypothetical protein n=1 Tax=Streptomyces sp. ID05-04B TaxID=3028661 RepID=UPI0029C4C799|nr:hypothetical protein [Streptomyces sp. ID05-04B]MDX5566910.1 hypothetical protein [Streptomyces sp. ID05-04B]
MKSRLADSRDLASALRRQARRTGERSPSVRGSDWSLATVATVNTDGTIVTTDGITCRRLETYTMPLVGDIIVISESSSGNWLTLGRTDSGSGTPWQPYTPSWTASPTNPVIGNGSLTGRYTLLPNNTCHVAIRLAPGSTTTFGSGTYVFGLPVPTAADTVEYGGYARLSAGSTYIGQVSVGPGTSSMNATFPASATPATAANMSPTTPATLASGHVLRLSLTYQHA